MILTLGISKIKPEHLESAWNSSADFARGGAEGWG